MAGISQKANEFLKAPQNEMKKSRRKRSVSSEKLKYGKCPKDFVKLSEYLCVHQYNDIRGVGVPSLFEDSQQYCKDKAPGSSLLYFLNSDDALNVWKWLGKCFKPLILFFL